MLKRLLWESLSTGRRPFMTSPWLAAEPLKKKKRIDPAVIKAREERKRKRIEKQIRRLQKNSSQLKPIDECEVPAQCLDGSRARTPPQTDLRNASLLKQWCAYRARREADDWKMVDRILYSQQRALDQLKLESPELYLSAIQPDDQFFPYEFTGPTETPPVSQYDSPDGEYIDISKKWDND